MVTMSTLEEAFIEVLRTWFVSSLPKTSQQEVVDMNV
jgi:hypothetical protein